MCWICRFGTIRVSYDFSHLVYRFERPGRKMIFIKKTQESDLYKKSRFFCWTKHDLTLFYKLTKLTKLNAVIIQIFHYLFRKYLSSGRISTVETSHISYDSKWIIKTSKYILINYERGRNISLLRDSLSQYNFLKNLIYKIYYI